MIYYFNTYRGIYDFNKIKENTLVIKLNQRLLKVSEFIKQGTLADIGSDHAYLPIFAIQSNLSTKAIAGEVIKGPFEAAQKNVNANELDNEIDVRLGDGLSVIRDNEQIDNITICGMGGPLIAKILEEGQHKLHSHPRLILQSNIQTQNVRTLLQSIQYKILDEIILEEKGHIYEIVIAEYQTSPFEYNEYELKFGPILLENKNKHFYNKWERELKALEKIKQQLNPELHLHRYNEIESEIKLIKEVLNSES